MSDSSIIVGVGVLVLNQGKVLLGQRLGGTWDKSWSLPGGKVDPPESLLECGARELFEETGIRATGAMKLISNSVESSLEDDFYTVTYGVLLEEFGGKLVNCEPGKFVEWKWVDLLELPGNLFPPTVSVLSVYLDRDLGGDYRREVFSLDYS